MLHILDTNLLRIERSVEQARALRSRGLSTASGPCQGSWYCAKTKSHESIKERDRAPQITARRMSGRMLNMQTIVQ